jgi:hypothetical protein
MHAALATVVTALCMVAMRAPVAAAGDAAAGDPTATVAQVSQPRGETNQLGFRGQTIRYGRDDVVVVLVGGPAVTAAGCAYAAMPERRLEHYLVLARTPKVFSLGVTGGVAEQVTALRRYLQDFRADAIVVWESAEDVKGREALARARAGVEQLAELARASSAAFVTFWAEPSIGPCISGNAAPAEADPSLLPALSQGFEAHALSVPDRRLDERAIDSVMRELAYTLIPRFSVGPTRPLVQ